MLKFSDWEDQPSPPKKAKKEKAKPQPKSRKALAVTSKGMVIDLKIAAVSTKKMKNKQTKKTNRKIDLFIYQEKLHAVVYTVVYISTAAFVSL